MASGEVFTAGLQRKEVGERAFEGDTGGQRPGEPGKKAVAGAGGVLRRYRHRRQAEEVIAVAGEHAVGAERHADASASWFELMGKGRRCSVVGCKTPFLGKCLEHLSIGDDNICSCGGAPGCGPAPPPNLGPFQIDKRQGADRASLGQRIESGVIVEEVCKNGIARRWTQARPNAGEYSIVDRVDENCPLPCAIDDDGAACRFQIRHAFNGVGSHTGFAQSVEQPLADGIIANDGSSDHTLTPTGQCEGDVSGRTTGRIVLGTDKSLVVGARDAVDFDDPIKDDRSDAEKFGASHWVSILRPVLMSNSITSAARGRRPTTAPMAGTAPAWATATR
ncbi:MAG: hypothetical protein H6R00_4510 [Proteobacteria bacterium]|nr:hypothetical protein [Pseudomonadota bacterium]